MSPIPACIITAVCDWVFIPDGNNVKKPKPKNVDKEIAAPKEVVYIEPQWSTWRQVALSKV